MIGASPDTSRAGGRVFANLVDSGFVGPVVPVSPRHAEVAGRPAVPDLASLERDIDLAVIATPAATAPTIPCSPRTLRCSR